MADIKKQTGVNAGFWWRVLAFLIDGIMLNIAFYLIQIPLVIVLGASETNLSPVEDIIVTVGMIITFVVSTTTPWLYFTLMESSEWQATPGKKWLGLIVTDMDGQRISFGKANVRYWSKLLSAIILCIGYFMVAFTERKQGLHDIIAGTLVLKSS